MITMLAGVIASVLCGVVGTVVVVKRLGCALLAVVFALKKLRGEAPRLLPVFRRRSAD